MSQNMNFSVTKYNNSDIRIIIHVQAILRFTYDYRAFLKLQTKERQNNMTNHRTKRSTGFRYSSNPQVESPLLSKALEKEKKKKRKGEEKSEYELSEQ